MFDSEDLGIAASDAVHPRPGLAGPDKRVRDKAQLGYRAAIAGGFASLPQVPVTAASISVLLPQGDFGLLAVSKNLVDALVSTGVIADDRSSVVQFRAMRVASEIDDPFTVPTTEVEVLDMETGKRYLSSAVFAPVGDVPAVDSVEGIAYSGGEIGTPAAYSVALTGIEVKEGVNEVDFVGQSVFAVIGGKHTCDPDNALARMFDAIQLKLGDRYLMDDVISGVAYMKDTSIEGIRVWLRDDPAAEVPFEEFVAYFLTGDEPPLAILVGNPDIPTL